MIVLEIILIHIRRHVENMVCDSTSWSKYHLPFSQSQAEKLHEGMWIPLESSIRKQQSLPQRPWLNDLLSKKSLTCSIVSQPPVQLRKYGSCEAEAAYPKRCYRHPSTDFNARKVMLAIVKDQFNVLWFHVS